MKNLYLILFLLLIVANIIAYRSIITHSILEVSVLEVGDKGDSILIRTPNGKTILIDTGPDASILRALGTTLPQWNRNIDFVALTSSNIGSTGGLPEVTGRYHAPTPILFGTVDIPYGSRITINNVLIDILYIGTMEISYSATSLYISSTTPKGVYISDGKTIKKPTQ